MASSSVQATSARLGTTSTTSTSQYVLATIAVVLLPLAGYLYNDYRQWYDLGEGGVPHNFRGWLFQTYVRSMASRDVRSVAIYESLMRDEFEGRSYIEPPLPSRESPRPKVGHWVVPHRQLEDFGSPASKQAIKQYLDEIAQSNSTSLQVGQSKIELGSPALFINTHGNSLRHPTPQRCPEEVFHVHNAEGSVHTVLSAADAKQVIEKGWGERHGLSGKYGFPIGYTMVYAARTIKEVEVIMNIAKATASYGLYGGVLV